MVELHFAVAVAGIVAVAVVSAGVPVVYTYSFGTRTAV